MRILILLAIALLLYIIISNLVKKMRAEERAKAVTSSEQMVRCEHCGLHILEQEALKEGRDYFCSQEHIEAYRNQE